MLTLILVPLCLSGCSGYVSSYKALMMVSSQNGHTASLRFSALEGTKVLQLNPAPGQLLRCRAAVREGEATVSYDEGGGRTELFRIAGSDQQETAIGPLTGKKVHIIITTVKECKDGDFSFILEEPQE